MRVIDRLSCTTTLRLNLIPMPPTTITEDIEAALEIVRIYDRAVFKPLYSSKAKGMVVVENNREAREKIERFRKANPLMYIQKLINHRGRDLGVTFLGGEYLTTYARNNRSSTSWNTTTRSGGAYEACRPDPAIIELARRAQDPFGLDFTCVDIAETPDGPVVFEVSAFGGFRGIETADGIDVAPLLVEYVINRLEEK
jgi:ribosomal protein S6--L-glutamate ligase